jgi:HSP20 family protein
MTLFDPLQELDRLTGSIFGGAGIAAMPVDLFREGDHYVLNADLPGFPPQSVDVSVDGQTLTLRAERSADAGEGAEWLARERPRVSLVRSFSVGEGVDPERITVSFENGVLSLVIPVGTAAKPRKIPITGSAARPLESGGSNAAGKTSTLSRVAKKLRPGNK